MNVVVAGLSPRDEAAFGFFMSRSMKGLSWSSAPAGRDAVLPPADLLVADLASLGLAQWSQVAEADLLARLHGTPAVLLVPPHDRTWATMDAGAVTRNALFLLSKPYGAEDMRLALEKAVAAVNAAAAPVPARRPVATPAPSDVPVVPAVRSRAASLATPRAAAVPTRGALPVVSVAAPPTVRPQAATGATDDVPQLSAAGLQTRLALLAPDGRHVFLRKLSEMLSLARPFEARFTVQNSVIFHPVDGWVASNTPLMVIERVCRSDALASAVVVREIDVAQAEERSQRLGMPLRELDSFLWDLAAAALTPKPSRPAGSSAL